MGQDRRARALERDGAPEPVEEACRNHRFPQRGKDFSRDWAGGWASDGTPSAAPEVAVVEVEDGGVSTQDQWSILLKEPVSACTTMVDSRLFIPGRWCGIVLQQPV